jgi:glycosyltransferase involved in cell wall biosynthesis
MLLAPAESLHTGRWAGALAGAGHRVVVASWQPGSGFPATQPQVAPVARLLLAPAAELRVAPAAGAALACRLPLAVPWLRRLVREVRPDVVHVHSLGSYGLLALALPAGPPRVLTPWGSELRAARRSPLRAAVIRRALSRADLVLPTSAEVAAEVTSRYAVPAQRTHVLSWGVPDELLAARPVVCPQEVRAAFGVPADATVVLSVRSATATYRIHEIVSAFARAATGRPDLFLIVLGGLSSVVPGGQGRVASGGQGRVASSGVGRVAPGGPGRGRGAARRARQRYLDQVHAAAAPVADRVLIVDRTLSPRRVFELMCAADLAVSIPPADQRSSSVLEAALAGCHLLLSDIAPYRELVRDGLSAELLAEPAGRSLASALLRARADDRGWGVNEAFIRAHEHGSDKVAALELIYRRLQRIADLR